MGTSCFAKIAAASTGGVPIFDVSVAGATVGVGLGDRGFATDAFIATLAELLVQSV